MSILISSKLICMSMAQFFLIMLPMTVNIYLLKNVSFDLYGKLIFFLSLFNFLSILTNSGLASDSLRDLSYSFNSHSDNDAHNFNKRMSEYIGIKIFYLCISVLLCFVLSFADTFNDELFYCLFIYLLYFSLDFLIFYQVIDKIFVYLCTVSISFLITVTLLFIFVHDDKDIYYVPFFATVPFIILNTISLLYHLKLLNFNMDLNLDSLMKKLKANYRLMFSNLSSALVTKGVYLFIGSVLGVREVAIYSVLDQICRAPLIFINRFSSLYTPKIVRAISQKNDMLLRNVFSKVFTGILSLSLVVGLCLAASGYIILPFFIHNNYLAIEVIMPQFILLLTIIPCISLSSLCAIQYYVNLNNDQLIYRYSIALLIVGLPFMMLFTILFNLSGLIISYALVEFIVLIYFLSYLHFNPLRVCYVEYFNQRK